MNKLLKAAHLWQQLIQQETMEVRLIARQATERETAAQQTLTHAQQTLAREQQLADSSPSVSALWVEYVRQQQAVIAKAQHHYNAMQQEAETARDNARLAAAEERRRQEIVNVLQREETAKRAQKEAGYLEELAALYPKK